MLVANRLPFNFCTYGHTTNDIAVIKPEIALLGSYFSDNLTITLGYSSHPIRFRTLSVRVTFGMSKYYVNSSGGGGESRGVKLALLYMCGYHTAHYTAKHAIFNIFFPI